MIQKKCNFFLQRLRDRFAISLKFYFYFVNSEVFFFFFFFFFFRKRKYQDSMGDIMDTLQELIKN